MQVPENLLYSKDHEWAEISTDKTTAKIGITDYAQEKLGDIVFVEVKEVGTTINQFAEIGTVESVKAASDVFTPLSGTVEEINQNVINQPELINQSPYENGWIAKIKITNVDEINSLLNPSAYTKLIGESK